MPEKIVRASWFPEEVTTQSDDEARPNPIRSNTDFLAGKHSIRINDQWRVVFSSQRGSANGFPQSAALMTGSGVIRVPSGTR
jgi:hypothetical protein